MNIKRGEITSPNWFDANVVGKLNTVALQLWVVNKLPAHWRAWQLVTALDDICLMWRNSCRLNVPLHSQPCFQWLHSCGCKWNCCFDLSRSSVKVMLKVVPWIRCSKNSSLIFSILIHVVLLMAFIIVTSEVSLVSVQDLISAFWCAR